MPIPRARNKIVGAGFHARPWIRWITRNDTEVVPYNFGKCVGVDAFIDPVIRFFAVATGKRPYTECVGNNLCVVP